MCPCSRTAQESLWNRLLVLPHLVIPFRGEGLADISLTSCKYPPRRILRYIVSASYPSDDPPVDSITRMATSVTWSFR